ncbi:MAG TPA: type III secretion system outer membrane ring subunit SctC, partial [Caulifigura sp.]|nr:type III secretion system outer membrane ring subunit SctC [Caulifigura sp.]
MLWRVGQGCLLGAIAIAMALGAPIGSVPILRAQEPPVEQRPEFPDAIPWNPGQLSHVAKSEPIGDLLREFASDQAIPIVISDKVTGTISGQFGPAPPRQFLDEITQRNGLIWAYDGTTIYVYRSDEIKSEILPVRGVPLQEIVDTLRQLGIWSSQYPIRILGERRLMYVTGPPRYIQVVSELATKIQQQAAKQASVEIVMEVFPLQYAWADDQSFTMGGNQVIVPGVATILRALINGGATGGGGGTSVQQIPRNLPSLRGSGLIGPYNDAVYEATQSARSAELAATKAEARTSMMQQQQKAAAADTPEGDLAMSVPTIIQADPRINAVLIRDIKERMPEYKKIIQQLDNPTGLVQIEASIIDVDADAGFEWIPDATFNWLKTDPSLDMTASTYPIGSVPTPNVSVRIGSEGLFNLLTRFRVLETEGQAKLVSRPTVLTINNVEATLNSQEELFVKVNGFQTSDLFNVTVGTVLRIIPHIIDEGEFRRIKLIVTVEDGRRTEDNVDTVPIISRNSINTQAVLNEGESLLIGGLIREEVTKAERRIPFIGRVPGVKYLFASNEQAKKRFERIVLITPKVIDLPDRNCMFVPPGPVNGAPPQDPGDIRQPPRNYSPTVRPPS